METGPAALVLAFGRRHPVEPRSNQSETFGTRQIGHIADPYERVLQIGGNDCQVFRVEGDEAQEFRHLGDPLVGDIQDLCAPTPKFKRARERNPPA